LKRYRTARGYVFLRDGDRILPEHRHVAEQKLGLDWFMNGDKAEAA